MKVIKEKGIKHRHISEGIKGAGKGQIILAEEDGVQAASELIYIHIWPTCLRLSTGHKASLLRPGCET